MSFSRLSIFTLALTAALAFTADAADARAGGGMSFGSRGGRTFDSTPPTPTAPKADERFRVISRPEVMRTTFGILTGRRLSKF
jgi:hypothetical protein